MRRVWNILAAVALFVMFAMLAIHWDDLPERIPTHYDISGQPNRWGPKANVFWLPGTGALIFVLLTVISRRRDVRFNVPFGLDQGRPDVRQEIQSTLASLKGVMLVLLAAMQVQFLMYAMGLSGPPGPVPVLSLVLGTFVTLGVHLMRLRRLRGVE